MRIYVDHSHLWRHVTGLERITVQLFSREALAPLDVVPVRARRMSGMLATQILGLPARLAAAPSALLLCPGFPPTPLLQLFGDRVIPYIHDVFLLSRRQDLNWRAKAYSAWPFGLAVRRLRHFLVNSMDTATKLRAYCRDDAEIALYRPSARNTLGLNPGKRADRAVAPGVLRLVAVGTVEPRKNLVAAGAIVGALRERGFPEATLEVIGRRGWGDDWTTLSAMPGVTLHGYLPDQEATAVLDRADALISTSHEEGLGLPLLEAQYGGLPVIAPEQPVFSEVLGGSGIFINPAGPREASEIIAAALTQEHWRAAFIDRASMNLRRWNELASSDRSRVIEWLAQFGRAGGQAGYPAEIVN
jgi:glycosyltransferase involved in cell wall biosynthesis